MTKASTPSLGAPEGKWERVYKALKKVSPEARARLMQEYLDNRKKPST